MLIDMVAILLTLNLFIAFIHVHVFVCVLCVLGPVHTKTIVNANDSKRKR